MGKKSNIIEINGKKYDTHTGAPIGHAASHTTAPAPAKPITVHHESDSSRSSEVPAKPHPRSERKAAKKLTRHAPQRSTTLMRRAVKRPADNLKRHVRAQGHTDSLIDQPLAEIAPKLSFGKPDTKRLQRATHVKKSQLITHFNPQQPTYAVSVTVVRTNQPGISAAMAKPAFTLKNYQRQPAPDAADIFDRAIQQATSHLEPAPKQPRRHRLHLGRKHAKHARA